MAQPLGRAALGLSPRNEDRLSLTPAEASAPPHSALWAATSGRPSPVWSAYAAAFPVSSALAGLSSLPQTISTGASGSSPDLTDSRSSWRACCRLCGGLSRSLPAWRACRSCASTSTPSPAPGCHAPALRMRRRARRGLEPRPDAQDHVPQPRPSDRRRRCPRSGSLRLAPAAQSSAVMSIVDGREFPRVAVAVVPWPQPPRCNEVNADNVEPAVVAAADAEELVGL